MCTFRTKSFIKDKRKNMRVLKKQNRTKCSMNNLRMEAEPRAHTPCSAVGREDSGYKAADTLYCYCPLLLQSGLDWYRFLKGCG